MNLKANHKDEAICAASRCEHTSTVIDDTKKISAGRVALCDKHWQQRCEMTTQETEDLHGSKETEI